MTLKAAVSIVAVILLAQLIAPAAEPSGDGLTSEQQQALSYIDDALLRFDQARSTIPAGSYYTSLAETSAGFGGQLVKLRTGFDQTALDELTMAIRTEHQRILLWQAPPKLLPLSPHKTPAGDPPLRASHLSNVSSIQSQVLTPLQFIAPSPASAPAAAVPFATRMAFVDQHCTACHDSTEKKGGLDLESLSFDPEDPENFATWVKVHDRVTGVEMPPKTEPRPDPTELRSFADGLSSSLVITESERIVRDGRTIQRRLNAYEYENALRDLLNAPWLQIKNSLPDDGLANRFNKSGKALDISHVQLTRYMTLADGAIREAISVQANQPPTTTRRFYARDQKYLIKEYRKVAMNPHPNRQNIPLQGNSTDIEVRLGRAPLTVGDSDPVKRELEAVGWVGIAFPKWDRTPIPVAGRYRLRYCGYTIWAGPDGYANSFELDKIKDAEKIRQKTRWHLTDVDNVSAGRRDEPVSVYAEGTGQNRLLGTFDLTPEPTVNELEVWLAKDESVMPRATRLFRSRAVGVNPNAQPDGAPGVAFRWLEIEGPLHDPDTTSGYRLMFGDLPLTKFEQDGRLIVVDSLQPKADADRLLRGFVKRVFLLPAAEADIASLLALIHNQLDAGVAFADAMISGYTAALASPGFMILQERPGTLDDTALANRLALFLWNSPPDPTLRTLASQGELHNPEVLFQETERLLGDPKAGRFVTAFLDYWLELRRIEETTPAVSLYNDYVLDDALLEAALAESRLFFADLIQRNLPVRNVVLSDFTFLNERLAMHYGIADVLGVAMRRVRLPADSPRGGFLTQASVLKVTANGTTTSPVLRGKWITERIIGHDIPPPPPVGAVEPDIRGAVTIRQQLEKHREDPSCASCHRTMDPPGFALENFDVLGGWRDQYRAVAPGKPTAPGFGRDSGAFEFHYALPVDAAGELPDRRAFHDVRDFKRLLLENEAGEAQIARSLVQQLVIYATGSPVRFADRAAVELMLENAKADRYGVRQLIHEIVRSHLFQSK